MRQRHGGQTPLPGGLGKEGVAPAPRPHFEALPTVSLSQVQPRDDAVEPQLIRQLPDKRRVRLGFLAAQAVIDMCHHVHRPMACRLSGQGLQQTHRVGSARHRHQKG